MLGSSGQGWTRLQECWMFIISFSDDDDKDNHYSGRTHLSKRETIDKFISTPQQNNINDNVIENLNFINWQTSQSADELFVYVKRNTPQEKEDFQQFCNTRNKVLCNDIKCQVARCRNCGQQLSLNEIINRALDRWREIAICDISMVKTVSFSISSEWMNLWSYRFSPEQINIWTYRYSYDMDDCCV